MPASNLGNGHRRPRRTRLLSPSRPRLSAGAKRRQLLLNEKENAEQKFPVLNKLVSKWADDLRASSATKDRYAYVAVLEGIYRKALKWKKDNKLEFRGRAIAALQGVIVRKNSTPVGVVVGTVCARANRNAKTASRWATKLNAALSDDVEPTKIKNYL